ncbi:MAG: putative DNA binding domain-containing protein [Myxococcales bacterium]|nr:putative DNA binding domain-containing protein [Myxococcales bacterium]
MDDPALERLLRDLESPSSERKQSFSDADRVCQAICAYSNDMAGSKQPGYIFIGAKDDGSPSGLAITDKLLLDLIALRSDGRILPQPRMVVEKRTLRGAEMAVIEVFPAGLPPVRFKGVVWVRVGPRRDRANEAEERALSERRASVSGRTWDARPCDEASNEDLALDLFTIYRSYAVAREVVDENHRTIDEQLASLRFFDRRASRPTNAGVLLMGKDPRYFVVGAYIQVVRYAGTTQAADVAMQRAIDGDLLSVLRLLDELAKELVAAKPVAVSHLREEQVFEYPFQALREALVNAVIHRDYESNTPILVSIFEDRLEIQNPGSLYGDARLEDFPGVTAYRNPVLAEAAKVLGYVNRFGRGLPRILDSMQKNGSSPPRIEPGAGHFLVVLPRHA